MLLMQKRQASAACPILLGTENYELGTKALSDARHAVGLNGLAHPR